MEHGVQSPVVCVPISSAAEVRGGLRLPKADEAAAIRQAWHHFRSKSQSKPWKDSSQTTFLPKTQVRLRALLLLGLN